MSATSKKDYDEIMPVGELALTPISTRITKATLMKFHLIMAHYQSQVKVSIRTRISKQDVMEKIICDQFDMISKQNKSHDGFAMQLVEEERKKHSR